MSGPTFQCTVLLQKCLIQHEGSLAQFPFSHWHLVLCLFSREPRGCCAFQRWMRSLLACLVLVVVLLYSDYATLPSTWITESAAALYLCIQNSASVREVISFHSHFLYVLFLFSCDFLLLTEVQASIVTLSFKPATKLTYLNVLHLVF